MWSPVKSVRFTGSKCSVSNTTTIRLITTAEWYLLTTGRLGQPACLCFGCTIPCWVRVRPASPAEISHICFPSGSSVPAVVEYASTVLILNHRGAFLIPHYRRPANAGTRFSRHCLSGGYLAFYINCSFGLLFRPGPLRGICSAMALVILILAALVRLTSCIIICGLD